MNKHTHSTGPAPRLDHMNAATKLRVTTNKGTPCLVVAWHGYPFVDAIVEGVKFDKLTSAEVDMIRECL